MPDVIRPKEIGNWKPGREDWYPRRPFNAFDDRQSKEHKEMLLAIAELYDEGYRVEVICSVFEITPQQLLGTVRKYSHREIKPERFDAVDTDGTLVARIRAGQLGLTLLPSGVMWSGKCPTCGSVMCDGRCVFCRARIEVERQEIERKMAK